MTSELINFIIVLISFIVNLVLFIDTLRLLYGTQYYTPKDDMGVYRIEDDFVKHPELIEEIDELLYSEDNSSHIKEFLATLETENVDEYYI